MTRAWYVAATLSGREYRVRDALLQLAIEAWLPECRVRRIARRSIITINGPLFPGYLFVHADLAESQWKLLAIPDFETLLGCDNHPLAVDSEVNALRKLVDQCGGHVLIQAGEVRRGYSADADAPLFEQGQPVRITDGPYAGFDGVYSRPDVKGRIEILLDIFGRRTPLRIAEALVQPA